MLKLPSYRQRNGVCWRINRRQNKHLNCKEIRKCNRSSGIGAQRVLLAFSLVQRSGNGRGQRVTLTECAMCKVLTSIFPFNPNNSPWEWGSHIFSHFQIRNLKLKEIQQFAPGWTCWSSRSQAQTQVLPTSVYAFPKHCTAPLLQTKCADEHSSPLTVAWAFRSLTVVSQSVSFFGFVLLGIYSTSEIYRLMSFAKYGGFSALISLSTFSTSLSLSSPPRLSMKYTLNLLL